jgi:uncharacterized repeat protein (TIGR01451 family)
VRLLLITRELKNLKEPHPSASSSFQLITPLSAADLSVSKAATPATFTQGQNGIVYTILVSNVGNGSTSGRVTVTDTLIRT